MTSIADALLLSKSSFITRAYPTMKKNNPQTPILLREAAGTLPKVYARYEFGVEKSQSLEGLSDKQIEDTVTTLVKNSA
ncbi:NADH-ubiquinone oxidoreductase 10.5 kDa subunit [Colletotrichum higginsianum]|uniref:NADH-ubiquinone oxidoreductase 10.5 kDa subunit n=1 Tax=Colletotrichum higginsianum (strain IMI 349063) TaxID=759273 RepID=H1W558_COLHI|nr:NADH-ubiquinone oxidoreductase 10.5 kDa subunit [Colletotrichum higginsianum]